MKEKTKSEWLKTHYEREKYWANKIRQSRKGSVERATSYHDGYNEVHNIMRSYRGNIVPRNRGKKQIKTCRRLAKESSSIRILDIGCGSGHFLIEAAKRGWDVYGVDVSKIPVEITRKALISYGIENDNITIGTVDDVHEADFDIIFNDQLLEHLHPDSIDDFISACVKRLKPGGYLIIGTPESAFGPHDVTRNFEKTGTPPKGFHLHEYGYDELVDLVKRHELEPITYLLHPSLPINFKLPYQWLGMKLLLRHFLRCIAVSLTPNYSTRRFISFFATQLGFGIIIAHKKV